MYDNDQEFRVELAGLLYQTELLSKYNAIN